jgi:hypothetical protein
VALIPAILFGLLYYQSKSKVVLMAAIVWLLYAVYEELHLLRIVCSGECNMRIDLLPIYPILLVMSIGALVAIIKHLTKLKFSMKNKNLFIIIVLVIALGFATYLAYFKNQSTLLTPTPDISLNDSIAYTNTEYGFNFMLPVNWQGYSIIREKWEGTELAGTSTQNGPKLLIRNPKWTASAPYEDLPILVFTILQWNAYTAEEFVVSAAPIKATELARNNSYVFALPPRWDFDYSLEYEEAQDIMTGSPLQPFSVGQ